jgi:hypothetical protein
MWHASFASSDLTFAVYTSHGASRCRSIVHCTIAGHGPVLDRLEQPLQTAIIREAIRRISGRPGHRTYRVRAAMTEEERRELETALARLRQEHRDLDAAIEALFHAPGADILQIQRLKKRKLHLRDRIRQVEDQLTPDIIA